MIKKIILFIWVMLGFFVSNLVIASTISSNSNSNSNSIKTSSNSSDDCIQLNTDVPGVGKCIKPDQAGDTFGKVMWALMKLAINITIAVAFISLIVAGIMYSMSGVDQSIAWKWKTLLKKVIIGIVLLWLSWLILHTLNPNFFKSSIDLLLISISK